MARPAHPRTRPWRCRRRAPPLPRTKSTWPPWASGPSACRATSPSCEHGSTHAEASGATTMGHAPGPRLAARAARSPPKPKKGSKKPGFKKCLKWDKSSTISIQLVGREEKITVILRKPIFLLYYCGSFLRTWLVTWHVLRQEPIVLCFLGRAVSEKKTGKDCHNVRKYRCQKKRAFEHRVITLQDRPELQNFLASRHVDACQLK
jgi:hypothetical protein